jgi:hypothetical protein
MRLRSAFEPSVRQHDIGKRIDEAIPVGSMLAFNPTFRIHAKSLRRPVPVTYVVDG